MRHLVLVLGDQLNRDSAAFDGFDLARDRGWMSETPNETTHVWCHRLRIAFVLAAMRHFRDDLRADGIAVDYAELAARPQDDRGVTFADRLALALTRERADRLIVVEPGDWRVREELRASAARLGVPLEVRPDRTFLCSTEDFADYVGAHRGLPLETFYRWMRQRLQILSSRTARRSAGAGTSTPTTARVSGGAARHRRGCLASSRTRRPAT
jgi:deoxyribodipyrimidine photolyase-related protein